MSVSAIADSSTEGITFLYEVRPGACHKSYGVHVAEMARFPEEVVRAAKRKLSDLESQSGPSGNLYSESNKRLKSIPSEVRDTGKQLVRDFMEKVRNLPQGTEAEKAESVKVVMQMRDEVLKRGNPYLDCLIAQ